jgi:hypothetical protein
MFHIASLFPIMVLLKFSENFTNLVHFFESALLISVAYFLAAFASKLVH